MRNLRLAAMAAFVLGAAIVPIVVYAAGMYSTLPQVGQPSFSGGTVTGSSGAISSTTVPAGPGFLTGSEIIPADTQLSGGAPPQTVTIPVTMLGNFGGTPRNYLGNGDLIGTQVNGTSTVTCATTSAPTFAAISADRWECDANVGSGAGRTAIVTSSPSPPTGFLNVMKVFRTSGALLQPICVWQAVPNSGSVALAGNSATFSANIAALAGLAADNNNQVQMVIISGTGTDQGFNGSWTASPAITPAWTGITTVANQTITVTTTFSRFAITATIPATATEVGVGLCFTPTATGAGATDGFAFTGAQLERGSGASPYEFRSKASTIADNMQYIYNINEGALGPSRAVCHATTAGAGNGAGIIECPIVFPVPMYSAPTMSYAVGFAGFTTTAETTATACMGTFGTDTTVAFASSTTQVMIQCNLTSSTIAVGISMTLIDNGGTGRITAWTGL